MHEKVINTAIHCAQFSVHIQPVNAHGRFDESTFGIEMHVTVGEATDRPGVMRVSLFDEATKQAIACLDGLDAINILAHLAMLATHTGEMAQNPKARALAEQLNAEQEPRPAKVKAEDVYDSVQEFMAKATAKP